MDHKINKEIIFQISQKFISICKLKLYRWKKCLRFRNNKINEISKSLLINYVNVNVFFFSNKYFQNHYIRNELIKNFKKSKKFIYLVLLQFNICIIYDGEIKRRNNTMYKIYHIYRFASNRSSKIFAFRNFYLVVTAFVMIV